MRKLIFALCFAFWFARSVGAQDLPDLSIQLGPNNLENGLSVASAGDGQNVPAFIEGVSVRRTGGVNGHYLYVRIDNPNYVGPRDLYVTIEAFDEGFSTIGLQYDKSAKNPDTATKYSTAQGTLILTGARKWRSTTFYLPQARIGHGQNLGADFRLNGNGMAIRRLWVSARPPTGYNPDVFDFQTFDEMRVQRKPGMEFTFGEDNITTPLGAFYQTLSATSVESYVTWQSVEAQKDQWNWAVWDEKVAVLKKSHLKWVPFLIAGPAYATPLWFQNSADSRPTICLEHGQESRIQSIFNPALRVQIDRFISAFAARYRGQNVVESLLLGVSGTYGESIYAAGPMGGWTTGLTGEYHNHAGWWAGDALARASFRSAMQKRYRTLTALNRAWNTHFETWAKVGATLPEKTQNDRARTDFVEWYQSAMTDWSVFWVKTARKYFPSTEIYLCTGGNGDPQLGADFTAQARAIAPFGAGIRITNESSDYTNNFSVTREVATATRLYHTFCGFEPASGVNAGGVAARVYNATASGARQLHDYAANSTKIAESVAVLRASLPFLTPRQPRVSTAIYLPRESWALEPERIGPLYQSAMRLRDLTDLDFVTRRSVADGALKNIRVVFLTETPVLAPETAKSLEKWVRSGGVLVSATREGENLGARLYDNSAWRKRLFSSAPLPRDLLVPTAPQAPLHWHASVGAEGDENLLFGTWYGRETGGEWPSVAGATKRWSGARAGIYLPVKPSRTARLRLSLYVPGAALPVEIFVNGQTVQKSADAGLQEVEIPLSAKLLNKDVARLELRATGWQPSDKNSGDPRILGVALRQIEVVSAGGETLQPVGPKLQIQLNAERLHPLVRRVGTGWTVSLPDLASEPAALSSVLAALWRQTPRFLSGTVPLAPLDGRADNRFVTQTATGAIWFDANMARLSESP